MNQSTSAPTLPLKKKERGGFGICLSLLQITLETRGNFSELQIQTNGLHSDDQNLFNI